ALGEDKLAFVDVRCVDDGKAVAKLGRLRGDCLGVPKPVLGVELVRSAELRAEIVSRSLGLGHVRASSSTEDLVQTFLKVRDYLSEVSDPKGHLFPILLFLDSHYTPSYGSIEPTPAVWSPMFAT